MKIGFIGLGIMGRRMAGHLLADGHTLTVHNRTHDKANSLIAEGATWAESPRAVAENCDVLITMLAHPDAVRAVALGDDGFLQTLKPDALWVDCSTVNPSFSKEMATTAIQQGLRFIDAPVAGSKNQAANAELVFFAGADSDDLATIQPLFDVMGRATVHVGEPGMGTSLKMVVNAMLATAMASFAESVALGKSLGISEETLLKVLVGGPISAPFIGFKQDKITSDDYDAEFPLQWMHKDLQLFTTSAYETGAPSLLASVTKALYQDAINAGHGEDDFSAIYAYLNRDS